MSGSEKSVQVQIAQDDFETLKNNHYRLCFAKKVNGVYNVVWQSYGHYLEDNTFSWTPVFQIFGTNTFQSNIKVKAQTNTQNINLGEKAVLDKDGHLNAPATSDPKTAITLVDNYGPIHPGVNQLSTGVDGQQHVTPIYVAEDQIVEGSTELTPKESVMVWLEQNVETGTMFSDSKSDAVEIDLTSVNSATREYTDGGWITPSTQTEDAAVIGGNALVKVIFTTVGSVSAGMLMQKIGAKLTGVYHDITVDVVTDPQDKRRYTVTYKERQQLSRTSRRFLAAVKTPATADTLTNFVLEALSSLGVGYKEFDATSNI